MSYPLDPLPIYIGNHNNIYVRGLRNPIDRAFDNGKTLTFTLKDSSGANVAGAVDVAMPYVTASDGEYVGVLTGTISGTLTEGALYTAVVVDSGTTLRWEIPLIATVREE